jgi:hypothetical protein
MYKAGDLVWAILDNESQRGISFYRQGESLPLLGEYAGIVLSPSKWPGYMRVEVPEVPSNDGWWNIRLSHLRPRHPPTREQTSTWDDVVVWRPKARELVS